MGLDDPKMSVKAIPYWSRRIKWWICNMHNIWLSKQSNYCNWKFHIPKLGACCKQPCFCLCRRLRRKLGLGQVFLQC